MYSIVMMAAMTAAPEAPDFNGFFKNLFHHHHATSCGGCWGGCSGCRGSHYYSSCSGCGGCYGGCYGGCGGCFGSHYAPIYTSCSGCTGYSSCSGCTGSYYTACSGYSLGYYSAPHGYTAVGHNAAYYAPPVSYTTTAEQPVAGRNLPETRAQLLVRVPADAKLFADGQPTTLTGSERSFMTPEIAAGRDFAYTLKVEYTVEGQAKSESKKVVVRGGHMTAVDFSAPQTDRVSTEVTVTLPENSKLFVDGVAAGSKAGTHTFRTPELPKGQPFAYSFKAEVETNGRTESLVQRVVFKAGEAVKVDFTEQNATRTAAK